MTDHDEEPVRRGPGRPRDPGNDRAILDATMELVRTAGYPALTIDAVAQAAKVGRPTIYRRWPSKAALVIAVLPYLLQSPPPIDTGRLETDLVVLLRRHVSSMSSARIRRILPGLMADIAEEPELEASFRASWIEPWQEAVEQAIARAIERGEVREGLDAATLAELFVGAGLYEVLVAGESGWRPSAEERIAAFVEGIASEDSRRTSS
ncbi:MAG TPA: TetR/AcrR family transcriptional regulator [Acidimicrobiales bacterium]|nr:TetR/AcrR family transcriptional regulator [Acidimicrobiales bacterium]